MVMIVLLTTCEMIIAYSRNSMKRFCNTIIIENNLKFTEFDGHYSDYYYPLPSLELP